MDNSKELTKGGYAFELSGPNLDRNEVNSKDVKRGTYFMVKKNLRFPIHPTAGEDHKISKLVHQYEVIITTDEMDRVDGEYIKTVLPVVGWIRKSCIDDETLVEVTPDTLGELVKLSEPTVLSGCTACLRNSACFRSVSIQVRKHPVYLMAVYLLLQFLAEIVIFADLVTDIGVAYTLAEAKENWLFMLTCVFILAPYYIAWAAAFGYLQKRAMESTAQAEVLRRQLIQGAKEFGGEIKKGAENFVDNARKSVDPSNNKSDNNNGGKDGGGDGDGKDKTDENGDKPSTSSPDKKIQIFVILFAIAPIGVCFLVLMDIYLLIEDFVVKPIYLCYSKEILRVESHAESGYKKLRRVSEVVAETICQTVLQTFILIHFSGKSSTDVDLAWVGYSLLTSVLVLISWGIVLSVEAKGYGLHFYEYVTVILQGSFNFVPYLPAIERGKIQSVNWTDFRFDSHSVGLVSKALISPECELHEIKLSAYSLIKLTRHECKFLGQMLADSPNHSVKVIFSRSRREIEDLFNEFDEDNSRTFDFKEFLQLCAAFRQNDDGVVSAQDVAVIFSNIADSVSHEVYLTDLIWKINRSTERLPVVDYDSPVMYALKIRNSKLLTFMIAAKVCDDLTWEFYTTRLVTTNRHEDALMMCEERGIPIVIELISGHDLPAHDFDANEPDAPGTSDPYASVSVSGKVKRTETIMKDLNPVWKQPLLFIISPEDIPASLGQANARNMYRQKSRKSSDVSNLRKRKNTGNNYPNLGGNNAGNNDSLIGNANNSELHQQRLEINIKVYDYDEVDDDFFMGSYKHFLKWNLEDLIYHQNGDECARTITHPLKNRDAKYGTLTFRIYTSTLSYYLKHGNTLKDHVETVIKK